MKTTDTSRASGKNDAAPQASRAPVTPRSVFSLSEDETFELGRSLGRGLKGGELVVLEGDLGAGKTTFTRGLAAGVGANPEDVSSPSFTLVQEYPGGRFPIFHVDLYRIERPDEDLASLGIEEILTAGGVVVVEWGEKLPPFLRRTATTVRLHDVGEGSRRIEIGSEGRASGTRPRGDA
jgi:tRNA threonylcarbamoyladenosine biosynthesis protein TsaE